MLPILIMPDMVPEPVDEILIEASDSATDLTDLYEIEALWEAMPQAKRRGRIPLGPWVEIRHLVTPGTQSSDAAPASLQDCDQLLKLLLRRRADSLGHGQRKELRKVMHATGLGPAS